MQTVNAGYRSLSLLMELFWDRLLFVAAIAVALVGFGALGTLIG